MFRSLCVVLFLSASASAAIADALADEFIENLRAQGYQVVMMNRTWLGRIWVLARNKTTQRELVFNPATGEVLRDYSVFLSDRDSIAYDKSNTAPEVTGVAPSFPVGDAAAVSVENPVEIAPTLGVGAVGDEE